MSLVDKDTWYLITHTKAVANGQKGGRLYVIECGKCHSKQSWHPHSMSDPHIRKKFTREGWVLERKWDNHICPQCAVKPKAAEPQQHEQPLPQQPFLVETWESSSSEERRAFLHWFSNHAAECIIFLDQQRPKQAPPPLQKQWAAASAEDRMRVLMLLTRDEALRVFWHMWNNREERQHYIDHVIPLSGLPLLQCWNYANDNNRKMLLNWIETNILPKKTLADHWKAATPDEQQTILNRATSHLHGYIASLREEVAMAKSALALAGTNPTTNGATVRPTVVRKPREVLAGTIRKTDFADELGVDRCTVSGYLKRGMPSRPDGLLNIDEAREWVRQQRQKHTVPKHHHPHPATMGDSEAPPVPAQLDDDDEIARLSAKFTS